MGCGALLGVLRREAHDASVFHNSFWPAGYGRATGLILFICVPILLPNRVLPCVALAFGDHPSLD